MYVCMYVYMGWYPGDGDGISLHVVKEAMAGMHDALHYCMAVVNSN